MKDPEAAMTRTLSQFLVPTNWAPYYSRHGRDCRLPPPNLNAEAWTTAKVANAPLAVISPPTGAPNKGREPKVQRMLPALAAERPPVSPCLRQVRTLELGRASTGRYGNDLFANHSPSRYSLIRNAGTKGIRKRIRKQYSGTSPLLILECSARLSGIVQRWSLTSCAWKR